MVLVRQRTYCPRTCELVFQMLIYVLFFSKLPGYGAYIAFNFFCHCWNLVERGVKRKGLERKSGVWWFMNKGYKYTEKKKLTTEMRS